MVESPGRAAHAGEAPEAPGAAAGAVQSPGCRACGRPAPRDSPAGREALGSRASLVHGRLYGLCGLSGGLCGLSDAVVGVKAGPARGREEGLGRSVPVPRRTRVVAGRWKWAGQVVGVVGPGVPGRPQRRRR